MDMDENAIEFFTKSHQLFEDLLKKKDLEVILETFVQILKQLKAIGKDQIESLDKKRQVLIFLNDVGKYNKYPLEFSHALRILKKEEYQKISNFLNSLKKWYSSIFQLNKELIKYENFKKIRQSKFNFLETTDGVANGVAKVLFDLLEKIQFKLEDLEDIQPPTENITKFIKCLLKKLSKYKISRTTNEKIEIEGENILLSEIADEENLFTEDIQPPTKNITKLINCLLMKSEITDEENLLTEGSVKRYFIFASNKIFIDKDLTKSGIVLILMAYSWEVIGDSVCINLNGKNGKDINLKARNGIEPGARGRDGDPGNPGKRGGAFFGIGVEFYNNQNLTISVLGGNGGRGQDGGDGENGSDGETPTERNYKSFEYYVIEQSAEPISSWRYYFGGSSEIKKIEILKVIGKEGMVGGNGGNGGVGGEGGNSGIAIIKSFRNEKIDFKIVGGKGETGIGGNGGKKGLGGYNGADIRIKKVYSKFDYFFFSSLLGSSDLFNWGQRTLTKTRASNGNDGSSNCNKSSQILAEPPLTAF